MRNEEGIGFVISTSAVRGDIIAMCLSVIRDGKVIHRETQRAGDDASARMIARRFIGHWSGLLFEEGGDFMRPRIIGAHRGH